MAHTAVNTTNSAIGQKVERVLKKKDLGFASAVALQDYIKELMEAQEYCCELTGLMLELDEANGDPAMFASLDRIDSSGHYEAGNLQVVCRFANFWKGASDDAEFRRLIEVLRTSAPISGDTSERMEAALTRRLDRLGRQVEGLDEDLAVLGETLSLFIRFWMTVTPPLPEAARDAARAKGAERFEGFLQSLGRKLATGDRFLREVSRDRPAEGGTDVVPRADEVV